MESAKKFILYLRKSTDRDDVQTLSIPGQEEACMLFAKQHNLLLVEKIVEHVSAKAPGRPLFNKMMQSIYDGKANCILAYHPNRLARNSKDGGEIVYWLDTGKILDLKFPTFWFENSAQGKYMLNLEFAQSKRYTDDLAVVSRRGLLQKCNAGHFPGRAPLGYLNDRSKRVIVTDPATSKLVQILFVQYAKGTATMDDLCRYAAQLTASKVSAEATEPLNLSKQTIRHLLSNPFYYGAFLYEGKLYEGKHKPLISKRLFDRVQQVIKTRWWPKIQKQPGMFTRLMRCGTCGMGITAEVQKGHTYYRCTRKSREIDCKEPYIREEQLQLKLSRLLSQFNLPNDQADELLSRINLEQRVCLETAKTALAKRNLDLDVLQNKLDRLLESYLDRIISHETFTRKQRELFSEQQSVLQATRELETNPNGWLEPFRQWVNTARNIGRIAETGNTFEKKVMLSEIFGSNLFLEGKKPRGLAVKPWFFLQKSGRIPTTVHLFDLARSSFLKSDSTSQNAGARSKPLSLSLPDVVTCALNGARTN
jgi:site-specific DNA recombinase